MPTETCELSKPLEELKKALEATDMESVSEHLLELQKYLKEVPHLTDMLLPEDIGLLVKAERTRMQKDILAASMPKTRKKAAPRTRTPAKTKQEIIAELQDLEDF